MVEIFCWRILMSLPTIIILIIVDKQWSTITALLARIKRQPLLLLGLLTSSLLLGLQMFIFVWAPLNGHGLSASLGYFLLPLTMVLCGQIVYKERLTFLQKIAVAVAAVGVAVEFYMTGVFSWETLVIALGYPIYFVIRRKLQIEGIVGTFSDFLFVFIGCLIYFMISYDATKIVNDFIEFPIYIPMLGITTAIAFAMYFLARRLLPLSLFGLLGYVEPVLLTLVSMLFLHETVPPNQIISYGLIWLSVCILAAEGGIFLIKSMKRKIIY